MIEHDQKLFDEVIADAIDILRLSAAERAKVVVQLQRMQQELIGKLAEENIEGETLRTVKRVLKKTAKIIQSAYELIQGQLDLPGIAHTVADLTSHGLQFILGPTASALPIPGYFASVASNVLIEGAPSAEWWLAQEADARFKFANAVRAGLTANETNQKIIARIVGNEEQPGVMPMLKRNASALVHTSVQAVANDSRRNTFKANDNVIAAIRQVSTLDTHTSLICVAYSDKRWSLPDYEPIGPDGLPFNGGTPRHFQCRSVEVPVTKTFREMGIDIDEPAGSTRASDIGQVDASTTFDDFLKRRGQAYQDKVLGPGRAELWREGKITLRDLVNGEGNPISLEQLRDIAKRKGARR